MKAGLWLTGMLVALVSTLGVASEAPQRVVSAGGALSEWIVVLGGEAQLVGVDTTSRHPSSLTALPSIGYQRQLSAEGILGLRAQMLVGTDEMGPPDVLDQLRMAGVRIEILSSRADEATLAANLQKLGQLLGRQTNAQTALHAFHDQMSAIASKVAPERMPGVLVLLGGMGSHPLVAGRDTVGSWMLEKAGAHNLATYEGYKGLSEEVLLGLDPQALVLADRRDNSDAAQTALAAQSPALANSRALREGHVLTLDPTLLVGGLGPRLPDAVGRLSEALKRTAP